MSRNGPTPTDKAAVDQRLGVERVEIVVNAGRHVSALRRGDENPAIVLQHGGAQNAHTWDAVASLLDRPTLCIDLPGHGHSQWREDGDYRPRSLATDVADVVSELAPHAELVVGMSLGGMTAIAIADSRPDLVRRLAVVDVTPGSGRHRTGPLFDLVDTTEGFTDLEQLATRAQQLYVRRDIESILRGIRRNAVQLDDGTWRWRYDSTIGNPAGVAAVADAMLEMWDAVGRIVVPTLLILGDRSPAVSVDDIEEWRRRQPDVRVITIKEAAHAVQSDQPAALAQLLREWLEVPMS